MYVPIGTKAFESVKSGLDEIGLGECHNLLTRRFVRGDVPLYSEHESWIAYFYLEAFMEFLGYMYEII